MAFSRAAKRKRGGKKQVLLFFVVLLVFIVSAVLVFLLRHAGNEIERAVYPIEYEIIVNEMSEKYGVDKTLIYAVIRSESRFQADAVSSVGAIGLMQIMPSTFEWLQTHIGGEEKMDVDKLKEPEINIEYGTYLLSFLLERYEVEDTAICAYNAGLGKVDEWLADESCSDDGKTLKNIPFPETKNYLYNVNESKKIYESQYFSEYHT